MERRVPKGTVLLDAIEMEKVAFVLRLVIRLQEDVERATKAKEEMLDGFVHSLKPFPKEDLTDFFRRIERSMSMNNRRRFITIQE